jgi:hypothetical protein
MKIFKFLQQPNSTDFLNRSDAKGHDFAIEFSSDEFAGEDFQAAKNLAEKTTKREFSHPGFEDKPFTIWHFFMSKEKKEILVNTLRNEGYQGNEGSGFGSLILAK